MREPITLEELYDDLLLAEADPDLRGELWRFWQLVRIFSEKWAQSPYGHDGGGFWVVAVCGNRVLWYNDIEGGYALTRYDAYGQLAAYSSGQQPLKEVVQQLLGLLKMNSGDL